MDRNNSQTTSPPPKKRIFLRFFSLSCLIATCSVIVFGFSIIPAQKKKIISGLNNYSKLIHSALYPVISSAIVLEDYGEAIENSLMVIEENPIVLYVVFGRKDGSSIVNLRNTWHQSSGTTLASLCDKNHQIIHSPLVQQEVFNTCYPANLSGIDWGYIYIGLSTEEYHHDVKTIYLRTLWIAILSATVSFLVSFILARRLSMPIQRLAETTHRIGSGDLSVRADIQTGDEIEVLSRAINQMVAALQNSRDEITKKHEVLLETAHRAGMAEVAIDVLHNVGNVLNSINIISSSVTNKVSQSRIFNIRLLAQDIEENIDRLYDYFNTEGRAERMLRFLTALSQHLEEENQAISTDMAALSRHIGYIIDIVKCQQLYSKSTGIVEPVSVNELVHMAIQICSNTLAKKGITLTYEQTDLPDLILNRHKIIQILTNLITNAVDAVSEITNHKRLITISADLINDEFLFIRVKDNGIGVPVENLIKIFNHGFTTKQGGHGFGLHSCALFAQEMNGRLNVYSTGRNQGAMFELKLPVEYKVGQEC